MTQPYVLLLDDSTAIQKVVRIAFARYELTIDARAKLIEAEVVIKKRRPDVMILDAGLLDSEEALDQFIAIRKKYSTSELKVILLKSQLDKLDDDALEKIQCQKIVNKPFETREIVEAVLGFVEAKRIAIEVPGSEPAKAHTAESEDETRGMPLPPPPVLNPPQSTKSEVPELPKSAEKDEPEKGAKPSFPPPPPLMDRPKEADNGQNDSIDSKAQDLDEVERPKVPWEKPIGTLDESTRDENRDTSEGSDAFREETIGQIKRQLEERKDDFEAPDEQNLSALLSNVPKVPLHQAAKKGQKAFDDSKTANPRESKEKKKKLRVRAESTSEMRPAPPSESLARPVTAAAIQKVQSFGDILGDPAFEVAMRQAVEDYCARNFDAIAREVITTELRRLADEKARHLLDN